MPDDLQVSERLVVEARDQHRAAWIDLRTEQRGTEEIRKEDERVEAVSLGFDVRKQGLGIDASRGPCELFVEVEPKPVGKALLHGEKAPDVALGDREAANRHTTLPLFPRLQHVAPRVGDLARTW